MGEMIELATSDGATIGAYKAMPSALPHGGIVVVQEIFGVNPHIRSVTDRFAAAGYAALAPAIFDRAERGVELNYDDDGMARGSALAGKISRDQHLASIDAAIAELAKSGAVGIVGFCLGGSLAYAAATHSTALSAAVGYYGGFIADIAPASLKCPVILHFGEKDQHLPPEKVEAVKRAHPDMPIYTYPNAGHGFNCDARASFDKESADLAWRRTMAFLEQELRGKAAA